MAATDMIPGVSEVVRIVKGGIALAKSGKTALDDLTSRRQTSLGEYVKDSLIMTAAYTEQAIVDEEIYPHLLSTLHQMYASYVITALGLNEQVGGCTVRNMLRAVSTESFVSGVQIVNACFNDPRLAKTVTRVSVEGNDDHGIGVTAGVKDLDTQQQRLPVGKVIELTFHVEKDRAIKALLYVQINPVAIATDVADGFVSLNFSDSLRRRWLRMKAGEIGFIKDFLLQNYELQKMDDALRKDTTGTLQQMLVRQQNALTKAWYKLLGVESAKQAHNIASSTLIISKTTFDRACKLAGVNFDEPSDRNSFFSKSMMFMVVVVDTSFAEATIYTNGLNVKSQYPFRAIEKAGSSSGGLNMKDMMTLMSRGMAPKF